MTTEPRVTARDPGRKPGTPVKQTLDMPGNWREVQDAQHKGDARGSLLVPSGAGWVEHDTLGIAEEVAARWPNLRVAECVKRCDDCAALGHYPYTVVELDRKGKTIPILGFLRLDRRVIDTLWSISAETADQQRLADEHNARVRAEIEKKVAEQQKASLEIIGAALKSTKYDWRGPGGVKIGPTMSREDARRALTQN